MRCSQGDVCVSLAPMMKWRFFGSFDQGTGDRGELLDVVSLADEEGRADGVKI